MTDAAQPRPWLRRLAGRFEPSCWAGLVARVVPAAATEVAGVTVHTPDHFLGAAWPPAAAGLARWPEIVVIGSPAADNALAELFVHLPPSARLYLANLDEVDGALAAQILRDGDRNLEPYQRAGVDAFIAAERAREQEAIRSRFTDRDAGFERFRHVVLSGPPPVRS